MAIAAIAAVAAVLAILILAVVMLSWQLSRSRQLVERWAAAHHYTLLEADRRLFLRGPFWLRSGQGHQVFRIRVQDEDGRKRRGHVRVGGWFLGLFSDQVTVAWDR